MFSKHLITFGAASVAVNAYSACWWGYESEFDWEEDYNGVVTSWNETRWKLNDLGYAWGGNGAFYAYDGNRQFDQPMPDGSGDTGLKFSVNQDYCNENPEICTNGEYFSTYAGS